MQLVFVAMTTLQSKSGHHSPETADLVLEPQQLDSVGVSVKDGKKP